MKKALYIMGVLDDDDCDWLARHGQRQTVAPGTVLIQQGQPEPSALYVILEGQLSVDMQGRQVSQMEVGEMFGEVSFVDSRPPSATVRALATTHLLAIDRALIRQKLDSDPGFASRLYRAIAVFLADRLRRDLGGTAPDEDPDELSPELMDSVAMDGERFTRVLQQLRSPR